MAEHFYIRIRGKVQGPFDGEKLRQLARRGQFSRLHEVSLDGHQWTPARDRPELFAAVTSPAATTTAGTKASPQPAPANEPAVQTASAATSAATWFFAANGQEQGPVDFATLREVFLRQRLPPDTEVWSQGMPAWAPAYTIPGLVAATPNTGASESAGKATGGAEEDAGVIRALVESRPWLTFIVVVCFVYVALMLLGGLIDTISGARDNSAPMLGAGLMAMALAVVGFFGAWLLLTHARCVSALERTRSNRSLQAALAALKVFWMFVGISLIVLLALIVLAVIVAISMAGSLPRFN